MSRSAITLIARGFTDVFSVPALCASKRSPAMARKKPSAIWLRAELWVQRNRTRARFISEQAFHDDAVAPLPVELAVALVDAHDPEAAPLVEGAAGEVLREDARDDLPEASLGVELTERVQGHAAGAGAASGPCDIDRMLGHAGVGGTAPVRAGAGPGDDLLVSLGHHRGIPIALVGEQGGDLLGLPGFGLERRDPIGDALVVDRRDGGGIGQRRGPGPDWGRSHCVLTTTSRAADGRLSTSQGT